MTVGWLSQRIFFVHKNFLVDFFFIKNIFGEKNFRAKIFFVANIYSFRKIIFDHFCFGNNFLATFFLVKIFFSENFILQNLFLAKFLFGEIFLQNFFANFLVRQKKILTNFLQMSLWLEYIQDGPRNLPLKFGQNQVSNSWDIPDMDKCRQDKCCLDKRCPNKRYCGSWNLFKIVPRTYL